MCLLCLWQNVCTILLTKCMYHTSDKISVYYASDEMCTAPLTKYVHYTSDKISVYNTSYKMCALYFWPSMSTILLTKCVLYFWKITTLLTKCVYYTSDKISAHCTSDNTCLPQRELTPATSRNIFSSSYNWQVWNAIASCRVNRLRVINTNCFSQNKSATTSLRKKSTATNYKRLLLPTIFFTTVSACWRLLRRFIYNLLCSAEKCWMETVKECRTSLPTPGLITMASCRKKNWKTISADSHPPPQFSQGSTKLNWNYFTFLTNGKAA